VIGRRRVNSTVRRPLAREHLAENLCLTKVSPCDYNVLTMRAKIIKIGNSQGVRIPKLFLEQTQLGEEVEIEAQDVQIIIRPVTYPRQGWDEAFQAMAENGDDHLLDDDLTGLTQWDQEEWQW
jgi:antitoxin MazE